MSDMDTIDRECSATWILIRGLGREAAHWADFKSELVKALPAARIECIDWPGNGEFFAQRSPCTIDEGVEHVRRICQQRGLRPPFVLVGISMGGMAALKWLCRYPDEVMHAHVINTSVGGVSYWYERMHIAASLRLLSTLWSVRVRESSVFSVTTRLCKAKVAVVRSWLDIARARPVCIANLLRQMLSAARFSLRKPEHSEKLTLYVSKGDQLVNPMCSFDIARLWAVPLNVHPDAGHDLPLDDPLWLCERLLAGNHLHRGGGEYTGADYNNSSASNSITSF